VLIATMIGLTELPHIPVHRMVERGTEADGKPTRSTSGPSATSQPSSSTEAQNSPPLQQSKYIGQVLYPLRTRSRRRTTSDVIDGFDGLSIQPSTLAEVSNRAVNVAINPRFGQIAIGTEKYVPSPAIPRASGLPLPHQYLCNTNQRINTPEVE
jgi:hypothetical protein